MNPCRNTENIVLINTAHSPCLCYVPCFNSIIHVYGGGVGSSLYITFNTSIIYRLILDKIRCRTILYDILCFLHFLCYVVSSPFTINFGGMQMEITIILSMCILALLVCCFIRVPTNYLAIRRHKSGKDYRLPGLLRPKWPWHSFTLYATHINESEKLTYYALTSDLARIHVKLHAEWTQYESWSITKLPDVLFKQISATVSQYTLEDIRSSRTLPRELTAELKHASGEAGYFLFKLEILSILEEALTFSSVATVGESTVNDTDNVRELSVAPRLRPILSCIPGGMRGHSYRIRRTPTHLRLVKPDDDSS